MEKRYWQKYIEIVDQLVSYNPGADVKFLEKAFEFAYEAHKGQLRRSGEPYVIHCLEVGKILADLKLDYITIAAGFLHDVAEDTNIQVDELKEKFGEEISALVNGVTKISELRFESREVRQAENFRKMLLSMIADLRIILIKFADRLHNMRTIEHLPKKSQERIARETKDVYAPLAHRFGIARIKWELEDLSLRVLDYPAYKNIEKKVQQKREEREKYLGKVVEPIKRELERLNIKANVFGRVKHFNSIYNKMKNRGKSFEEILDLLAIRVIVFRVEDCYFALGVVHSLFTPVHEMFNDYIAVPKPNMYRSLHTKIIGPGGHILEVQIRTEEMDSTAEVGIAAHWRYKEGKAAPSEIDAHAKWLRQLFDWQMDNTTSSEFMEDLKINLFHDEIFVFTPKGELITLPTGSTPIDFAFAVHSDVGVHTIGAKVSGKIVPLNSTIYSGDTVEVITSANQKPSIDWLKFVRTPKARSRIKRYFRDSQFDQSVKLGKEIVERGLERLKLKLKDTELDETAVSYGHNDVSQLYAAVGAGDIPVQNVIRKLIPRDLDTLSNKSFLDRMRKRLKGDSKGIKVHGLDNTMISFAPCCRPLPGDKITGFITVGEGITIHRTDCPNIESLLGNPERNIAVEWDAERDSHFNTRIQILSVDRPNLLRDITNSIASLDVNIVALDMNASDSMATGDLILEVHNLPHLIKIIRAMRSVKGVVKVDRIDQLTTKDRAEHSFIKQDSGSGG